MAWCSVKAQGQVYLYLGNEKQCTVQHPVEYLDPSQLFNSPVGIDPNFDVLTTYLQIVKGMGVN
jgi:hypothetical protein